MYFVVTTRSYNIYDGDVYYTIHYRLISSYNLSGPAARPHIVINARTSPVNSLCSLSLLIVYSKRLQYSDSSFIRVTHFPLDD